MNNKITVESFALEFYKQLYNEDWDYIDPNIFYELSHKKLPNEKLSCDEEDLLTMKNMLEKMLSNLQKED